MEKNLTKIYNLTEQTKSVLSKKKKIKTTKNPKKTPKPLSKCSISLFSFLYTEEAGNHVGCILPMLLWKGAHFR